MGRLQILSSVLQNDSVLVFVWLSGIRVESWHSSCEVQIIENCVTRVLFRHNEIIRVTSNSYPEWPKWHYGFLFLHTLSWTGERGGSVVECRTPEREVRGSRPTAAVLCPWARHFTPRKYWLITQEAMAPSRHDWKIVDWDVKPQHNQPTFLGQLCIQI